VGHLGCWLLTGLSGALIGWWWRARSADAQLEWQEKDWSLKHDQIQSDLQTTRTNLLGMQGERDASMLRLHEHGRDLAALRASLSECAAALVKAQNESAELARLQQSAEAQAHGLRTERDQSRAEAHGLRTQLEERINELAGAHSAREKLERELNEAHAALEGAGTEREALNKQVNQLMGSLASHQLGDERPWSLAGAAELQHVHAVVVGLDDGRQRPAFTQRRDIAGDADRAERGHAPIVARAPERLVRTGVSAPDRPGTRGCARRWCPGRCARAATPSACRRGSCRLARWSRAPARRP